MIVCEAYFQTLQLSPSRVFTSTLPQQFSIDFDITEDECCNRKIINNTIDKLSPIHLSHINLESLNVVSQKLDYLENLINQAQNQSQIVKHAC